MAVHLYVQSRAQLTVRGQKVGLRQETAYPWEGAVTIRLELDSPLTFGLRLRLPGWCRAASLNVNGDAVEVMSHIQKGYIYLEREWRNGDALTLDLPMPVERVYAHPNVRYDVGRVALQRGPIVYCLEAQDHAAPVSDITLPGDAPLTRHFDPGLLGGVMVINAEALAIDGAGWGETLYRSQPAQTTPCPLTAIPYCVWGNREVGGMTVWVREQ